LYLQEISIPDIFTGRISKKQLLVGGGNMRRITVVIVALMLLAFGDCANQEESSRQSVESQKTVSAPKTDLHSAVVIGDLAAIRQHIEAGSDLNVLEPSRASTPLITAAALGKTEAAKMLMDAGADLNYQNNDGSTALHTAAFFCRVEIVEALLEKGADTNLKNNTGKTALEVAELPFEVVKPAYDAMGVALKPAGVVLDYDYIEATRPEIAEMLKQEEAAAE
jgi:ankyrin repeat protein